MQPFDYSSDRDETVQAIDDNEPTIRNIRLLDPKVVLPTYQNLQAIRGYYRFNELDVDRYKIQGPVGGSGRGGPAPETEVVLGNRDLNQNDLPQQSWEGRHVNYTHGYATALSPANGTNLTGQPDFLLKDVPVNVDSRLDSSIPEITQPQLYFGENLTSYSIVGTKREEVDYLDSAGADDSRTGTRARAASRSVHGFARRRSSCGSTSSGTCSSRTTSRPSRASSTSATSASASRPRHPSSSSTPIRTPWWSTARSST